MSDLLWIGGALIVGLLVANFGPGRLAFMRTTRRGNARLRALDAAFDREKGSAHE